MWKVQKKDQKERKVKFNHFKYLRVSKKIINKDKIKKNLIKKYLFKIEV